MIDVHVPQKSEHTWTDFAIHIATICVGLLIAIGLEQSVEYIHHARERSELREALYVESAQIVTDSRRMREVYGEYRIWISIRMTQLSAALRDDGPVPPAPKFVPPPYDRPNDPIWKAAKTSNSAELLSSDELAAYGELSENCVVTSNVVDEFNRARRAANAYARRFGGNMLTADLSHASRPEIKEMIERLAEVDEALREGARYSSLAEGAADVIRVGERDMTKIYAAEKRVDLRSEDALAAQLATARALPSSSPTQPGQ